MARCDRTRIVGMSDKELDEITCCICYDLFNDPVVVQCCLQTYCRKCIEKWIKINNNCPHDRKSLAKSDLNQVPRVLTNILNNLLIKCEFEDIGCEVITTISESTKHLKNCSYNPINNCKICGLTVIFNEEHDCVSEKKDMDVELKIFCKEKKNSNKSITCKTMPGYDKSRIVGMSETIDYHLITNQMIVDGNEHNCIENLVKKNKNLADQVEGLCKKVKELEKSNKAMEMNALIKSAQTSINDFKIKEPLYGISSEEKLVLINKCKVAVLNSECFESICDWLSPVANQFLQCDKHWHVNAFCQKCGETVVFAERFFRIEFNQVIIEVFTVADKTNTDKISK